jgi:hypothetical protein
LFNNGLKLHGALRGAWWRQPWVFILSVQQGNLTEHFGFKDAQGLPGVMMTRVARRCRPFVSEAVQVLWCIAIHCRVSLANAAATLEQQSKLVSLHTGNNALVAFSHGANMLKSSLWLWYGVCHERGC